MIYMILSTRLLFIVFTVFTVFTGRVNIIEYNRVLQSRQGAGYIIYILLYIIFIYI